MLIQWAILKYNSVKGRHQLWRNSREWSMSTSMGSSFLALHTSDELTWADFEIRSAWGRVIHFVLKIDDADAQWDIFEYCFLLFDFVTGRNIQISNSLI